MSFRTTLIWVVVALGLLGSIFFLRQSATRKGAATAGAFPKIDISKVGLVQVRPGRGLEIRAVRTNGTWRLVEPLDWPAQNLSIEQLLAGLEKLSPATYITPAELRARPSAEREYGFEDPKASIILDMAGTRLHLLAGAMTAPGDQFFLQIVGTEGAYVVGAEFLKLIPASVNDWRDRSLVDLNRLQFDRVDVTNGAKVFALERKRPGPWRLVFPIKARADQARMHDALEKIHSLRTQEFVSDDPKEDLEALGLQPPLLELGFKKDLALLAHLQFGKSVSNSIYARKNDWSTVVTVPSEFVTDWQKPVSDFRDPFLITISDPVQSISVSGSEPFSIFWETNGGWRIAPSNWPGDADLMKELIAGLNGLRIEQFVKDVVTAPDLPPYALDAPARVYRIELQGLDAKNTNAVELQFGAPLDGKVYGRRTDEDSVYSIASTQVQALPSASWQLRKRRIWDFPIEDVKSVSLKIGERTRELLRKAGKSWTLAPGSQGIIDDLAVDETVKGLVAASMDRWSAVGAENLARFGISDANPVLTIELNNGQRVTANFGNATASNGAYASVLIDGQTWIGEFPWILCRDIMAHLAPPEKKS